MHHIVYVSLSTLYAAWCLWSWFQFGTFSRSVQTGRKLQWGEPFQGLLCVHSAGCMQRGYYGNFNFKVSFCKLGATDRQVVADVRFGSAGFPRGFGAARDSVSIPFINWALHAPWLIKGIACHGGRCQVHLTTLPLTTYTWNRSEVYTVYDKQKMTIWVVHCGSWNCCNKLYLAPTHHCQTPPPLGLHCVICCSSAAGLCVRVGLLTEPVDKCQSAEEHHPAITECHLLRTVHSWSKFCSVK